MVETLPSRIALFPLSAVLFPGCQISLHLFEPRYLKLMSERSNVDPIFGVVLTRDGSEVGDQPAIHHVGTAASLLTAVQHDDGRFSMVVQGTRRFRVHDHDWHQDYLMADVEWIEQAPGPTNSVTDQASEVLKQFLGYVVTLADQLGNRLAMRELPGAIVDVLSDDLDLQTFQIAAQLPLNTWQQQALLEFDSIEQRLEAILNLVRRERKLIDVSGPATAPDHRPGATFSSN
jgi:Lon protease-like protein